MLSSLTAGSDTVQRKEPPPMNKDTTPDIVTSDEQPNEAPTAVEPVAEGRPVELAVAE
jgi:hypothetical protein